MPLCDSFSVYIQYFHSSTLTGHLPAPYTNTKFRARGHTLSFLSSFLIFPYMNFYFSPIQILSASFYLSLMSNKLQSQSWGNEQFSGRFNTNPQPSEAFNNDESPFKMLLMVIIGQYCSPFVYLLFPQVCNRFTTVERKV